ncbi:helix-turn-helix transcriptional regulator [Candidatus Saccharibacteria bacterium]|nr:helix-turn-helix transcriptional regulator [Candidatus Saccharibacteria bacterium]
MDKPASGTPYKPLGQKLKELRSRTNESLAEASGAVEIDVRQLASFELGQSRPTEDVLLLLLSHFSVKDDEAVRVWEIAGYNLAKIPAAYVSNDAGKGDQLTASTNDHVLFTDIVDVIVNNYGVVMNFMQNTGSARQPTIVAKVGMSREHAKSVLQILQMTLSHTEHNRRAINAPDNPGE